MKIKIILLGFMVFGYNLQAQVINGDKFLSAPVNTLQENFSFRCPGNSFLIGINSRYDRNLGMDSIDDENTGDRLFRFICSTFKDGEKTLTKKDCSEKIKSGTYDGGGNVEMTHIEWGIKDYRKKLEEEVKKHAEDAYMGDHIEHTKRMHKTQTLGPEVNKAIHQINSLFYCKFIGKLVEKQDMMYMQKKLSSLYSGAPSCDSYLMRARERIYGAGFCGITNGSKDYKLTPADDKGPTEPINEVVGATLTTIGMEGDFTVKCPENQVMVGLKAYVYHLGLASDPDGEAVTNMEHEGYACTRDASSKDAPYDVVFVLQCANIE